ncbi:MAG: hypothetical protein Q9217_005503 [Psora testacea]
MRFFNSLKGNHPVTIGGPSSQEVVRNDSRNRQEKRTYSTEQLGLPPPGPPPSHHTQYQTSSSLPPSYPEYAPSPAPPPSHQHHERPLMLDTPPQGPPPYHDWTVIPDTALLPPPPSVGHESGIAGNADSHEADRAHDWCKRNPLVFPHQPTQAQAGAVEKGDVRLMKPKEYRGELLMLSTGVWQGSTRAGSTDSCLLTSSPLYFAYTDSPTHTGHAKTIYFELEITSLGYGSRTDESSIAIGYCAMPYPTWRMPGWERASLAVHSDDGHRYVNDTWGGKDFTTPFTAGDTVGIGMSFSLPENPPEYNVAPEQSPLKNQVEIFFTRNGTKEGGWNLHEELDHETDQGIDGLDGLFDLYGAIGIFGGAEFRAYLRRDEWSWRPQ